MSTDFLSDIVPQDFLGSTTAPQSKEISISIYNPMARTYTVVEQTDEVESVDASKFLCNVKRRDSRLVRMKDITEYGELLEKVALWLQSVTCDGVIVPLRGGIKPFTQLNALANLKYAPCWLPFTQGANGLNKDEIRTALKDYLESHLQQEKTRLVVVDTADSGDSSLALAEILKSLREEAGGTASWEVTFILFFESQNGKKWCPPKSTCIPHLNGEKIRFRVFRCGTTSLITEDWDEGLGIKAEWKPEGKPQVSVIPSAGIVIVEDYTGRLRQYKVERLDQFIDELLAKEVSDAVMTNDLVKYERDVWQQHKAP